MRGEAQRRRGRGSGQRADLLGAAGPEVLPVIHWRRGEGEGVSLELGGTNGRTRSAAELVEDQRPRCVGGVRGCAVRERRGRAAGMADAMVDAMADAVENAGGRGTGRECGRAAVCRGQCSAAAVFKKTSRLAVAPQQRSVRAGVPTTNFSRASPAPSLLHGLLLKSATARSLPLSCRFRSWPRLSLPLLKPLSRGPPVRLP